ncbi:hypothetical protein ACFQ5N_03570 [Lutibacter holmesii]|uniref:Lipocalin-like domain-containing protein n=1 Tax=Lutibacter holmesii TaxID=1137985 RepID=A0ABW3WL96_9FLAO
MNIKNKVLSFLIFINFSLVAQTVENYDFIGTLILENNALITYRIQFDIKDSKISGFSYTDINGKDETKSELTGTYNSKEKNIVLKESSILYTKSKEIEDIFCFINVDAKLKIEKDKPSIQGDFVGLYHNKDTCATGKLLLVSLKDAFDKIEKVSKKISKTKKIDSVTKTKFTKEHFLNEIKPNTLKSDDVLTVFSKGNKFILEIWDNGKEDGDLISLTFNKKTVFRKYAVKKEKRIVELDLIEGENLVEILANNNGTIPPNTAKVILKDGEVQHTISTSLESGKSSKINIIYKP